MYITPPYRPTKSPRWPSFMELSTRLRQMLARPGIVVRAMTLILLLSDTSFLSHVAPGICDGISGWCAIEAGFDCLYYQRYVTQIITELIYRLFVFLVGLLPLRVSVREPQQSIPIVTLPVHRSNKRFIWRTWLDRCQSVAASPSHKLCNKSSRESR
jgi:hypothetical protein